MSPAAPDKKKQMSTAASVRRTGAGLGIEDCIVLTPFCVNGRVPRAVMRSLYQRRGRPGTADIFRSKPQNGLGADRAQAGQTPSTLLLGYSADVTFAPGW